MKHSGSKPRIENGIVVGTTSDKYTSDNLIKRTLVNGFDSAIADLLRQTHPRRVVEIGCGEGHVTNLILRHTPASIESYDISQSVIDEAKSNTRSNRVEFSVSSIYDLDINQLQADLVVCCEVLEHLPDPEQAIDILSRIAPQAILSVPREPLWRILNMLRGAYLPALGNTPGHIQHWSRKRFNTLIDTRFESLDIRTPTPWTAVLARSRLFD